MEKLKGKKDCLLTTYIAGTKYQAFIPLLVYSCKQAYPEYDIALFLHETLDPRVKQSLMETGLIDKVKILENIYNNGKRINRFQAQALRWVLWDDLFRSYKYLYIVDVDMFYIREPIPLHLQHKKHMDITRLPFDNLRRYLLLDWKGALRYAKNYHFKSLRFLITIIRNKGNRIPQLSGLHFVDVGKVYTDDALNKLKEYRNLIISNNPIKGLNAFNDECLLYLIMESLGNDCSKLACQTDSISMLSFEDPCRAEFRPHHGIHLGLFRLDMISLNDKIESFRMILESDAYRYYIQEYKRLFYTDDFQRFIGKLPLITQGYIQRLNNYYQI